MAYYEKRYNGWRAKINWYDAKGKRHAKSKQGFATKRQAMAWAHEMELAKDQNRITTKDPVFAEYFWEWATTYKTVGKSKGTYNRYHKIYERLLEYFGNSKLSAVTKANYQRFLNEFGQDKSKETVSKLVGSIRSCVTEAVNENIIPSNFTLGVVAVYDKSKTRKVEYLSVAEIKALISALESGLKPRSISRYMILTAIYTGMRVGEIMALTWDDLDYQAKTVRINKSYDYINGQVKEPKTASSVRTVRVSAGLLSLLDQLRVNKQNLIFANPTGKVPTPAACNATLKRFLTKCEIDKQGFHFHSLRHSHVALLLYEGVPLYAISKRLGHSDMSITAKKYAYLIDELKQRSDDRIDEILTSLTGHQNGHQIQNS